jgi:hypothetical protein
MGRFQTNLLSKKVTLILLLVLLSISGVYAFSRFIGGEAIEFVNFLEYRDNEIEANITSIGSGYYALISKKGKDLRLGILNESMLAELITTLNSVLKKANPISQEEFNSTRINSFLQFKQRSKSLRGANLTVINDFVMEINIFPNQTLIQINTEKDSKYYKSSSIDLRDFFGFLYNWSEYHTIKVLNLTWIKLQEMGKTPYKYKIGSISINQSSNKPIIITMVWQGCPCKLNPPETFQFSLEEVLSG